MGSLVAPPDAVQGQAQRLMYLHVPSAWTGFACFTAVLVGSLGYLAGRGDRWDRWARAAAEIGVVATASAITVGAVWGRAVWGVWWAWDPRLVSAALLLVAYLGCLAFRNSTVDPALGARRAALAGVASFPLVPATHCSVVWWRSLHQRPTLLTARPDRLIDPLMATALVMALVAGAALAGWVFARRVASLERAALGPPPRPGALWRQRARASRAIAKNTMARYAVERRDSRAGRGWRPARTVARSRCASVSSPTAAPTATTP